MPSYDFPAGFVSGYNPRPDYDKINRWIEQDRQQTRWAEKVNFDSMRALESMNRGTMSLANSAHRFAMETMTRASMSGIDALQNLTRQNTMQTMRDSLAASKEAMERANEAMDRARELWLFREAERVGGDPDTSRNRWSSRFARALQRGWEWVSGEPSSPPRGGGLIGWRETPQLATGEERRDSIIRGTPGIINLEPRPTIAPDPRPLYYLPRAEEVTQNDDLIEAAARKYDVPADYIRAIMWQETTHGWTDRVIPENARKSLRPMNVNVDFWKGLAGVTRKEMADPAKNIDAGTRIIKGIMERLDEPTIEDIATLYVNLRADAVSVAGRTAAHYYEYKPWLSINE